MGIEFVTSHQGTPHVSDDEVGFYNAYTMGKDSYVLGDVPNVTMADANTVSIPPCDLLLQGRHVRLTGVNTVKIQSGAQTGTRVDLVYGRMVRKNNSDVGEFKLGVITGTGGNTDPALPYPTSTLDGANTADVALARITLTGLTPTVQWLLPQLPTLAAVGAKADAAKTALDNMYYVKPMTGSNNVRIGVYANIFNVGNSTDVWVVDDALWRRYFGRAFNDATDFVFPILRGGSWWTTGSIKVSSFVWDSGNRRGVAVLDRQFNGNIYLTLLLVAGN